MLELGLTYNEMERYDEATKILGRLEEEFPKSEAAIQSGYEKGVALQASGDIEKAGVQFASVAEKHKGAMYGDKSLVGLGVIRQEQGEYAQAINVFSEVAARRTDELGAEAQYRIGETLFKQSKYKDAVKGLLRVKYIYPSANDWIARAYLMIGECYEKTLDKGKAREAYQTVLNSHKQDKFGDQADKKIKEMQ
jgi:TolA-binding protein